jgi:hypothetical protein
LSEGLEHAEASTDITTMPISGAANLAAPDRRAQMRRIGPVNFESELCEVVGIPSPVVVSAEKL